MVQSHRRYDGSEERYGEAGDEEDNAATNALARSRQPMIGMNPPFGSSSAPRSIEGTSRSRSGPSPAAVSAMRLGRNKPRAFWPVCCFMLVARARNASLAVRLGELS